MDFAILGIEKHSTMASVGSRLGHQMRSHKVPNADPAKAIDNQCSFKGTAADLVQAFKDRVDPLVKRKDNVRAIELMLSASPEWFTEGGGVGDWKELGKKAEAFVKETFGADNVMAFGVHLDEKTPHFWCFVSPIFNGKLNASHWLDGPPKMAELQTKWAMKCEPLGLRRGVKSSNATHTQVKDFYAAVTGDAVAAEKLFKETELRLRHKERLLEKRENLLAVEEKKQQKKAEALAEKAKELEKERALIDEQRKKNERVFDALTQVQQESAAEKFARAPQVSKIEPVFEPIEHSNFGNKVQKRITTRKPGYS